MQIDPEFIQTVYRTETMVKDIHTRLFGNGQPGELSKLDNRISSLEKLESKARGAIWVISGLFGILGIDKLVHLIRGK